jgi:hypothetical protein
MSVGAHCPLRCILAMVPGTRFLASVDPLYSKTGASHVKKMGTHMELVIFYSRLNLEASECLQWRCMSHERKDASLDLSCFHFSN